MHHAGTDEAPFAENPEKSFIERVDQLEIRASRLSVPTSFKPLVHALRLHIDISARKPGSP